MYHHPVCRLCRISSLVKPLSTFGKLQALRVNNEVFWGIFAAQSKSQTTLCGYFSRWTPSVILGNRKDMSSKCDFVKRHSSSTVTHTSGDESDSRDNELDNQFKFILKPERPASEVIGEFNDLEKQKLKYIKAEWNVLYDQGVRVPETVTDEMWLSLFKCKSLEGRKKLYKFYLILENRQKAKYNKKHRMKEEKINSCNDIKSGPTDRFFRIISNKTMNQFYDKCLINAFQYGQPLIFDFVYEDIMSFHEMKKAMNQLRLSFDVNRRMRDPFHFVFCNLKRESQMFQYGHNRIDTQSLVDGFVTHTAKCYTDLYPREQLVYLSPDAHNVLTSFKPNEIYIIGAVDDSSGNKKISRANAKRTNVRTARLPLDNYIRREEKQVLTIDQVFNILADIRNTKDWDKAMKHVPNHKKTDYYRNTKH